MVRKRKAALHDLLHGVEEALHARCVGIRILASELVVHLGEATAPKAVPAVSEINVHEA